MFSFCPLQGAQSESSASQSLFELEGGVKVLVDVGWDESFDVEKLKKLEKQVPTLSLILLTHATVSHLGAYAHCCKHIPLFTRIPVYATRPVIDLGRSLTQELYASNPLAATVIPSQSLADVSYNYNTSTPSSDRQLLLQAPNPDEIVRYFALIQPLKYSQPHQPLPSPFSPPLQGLTITAYNSGHTLGGTIWHLQHGLESIVYAVDWNHARENVFAGAAWLGGAHGTTGGTEVVEQLRKPTALVCSSRTPEASLALARRDEQLLESLKLCVNRGGTVLIPVDSTARVLELAYLLERAWRDDDLRGAHGGALKATRLFLAGRNVRSTMRLVKSMLEWMNEGIVREFEGATDGGRRPNGTADGARDNKESTPFEFRYLRLLEKKGQVDRVLHGTAGTDETGLKGKVILASDTTLEWGFSKDALRAIASDPRNLVILPQKPSADAEHPSLSRQLWEWWKERRDGVAAEQTSSGDTFEQVYGGGRVLEIQTARREALEGDDLHVYQQWLATQRQFQSALQGGGTAELEASADAVDDASSESSSESEDSETEQQGKVLNVSATMGQANRKKLVLRDEELGVTILVKKRGVYDFDVRGKKGRERMFPITIRRRRNDEFGELIRPDDFLRAEEREDADGNESGANAKGDGEGGLGRKRKWNDVATTNKNAPAGSNKRPQLARNMSADDLPLTATNNDDLGTDDLDGVEDDDDPQADGPAKLVLTTEQTTVNLRIAFVDFSGLHDKRNLNMLIPLIQPRKLILVAGTEDETKTLANDCRELLAAKLGTSDTTAFEVLTPSVGVAVDASVDTNAWMVKLADPLVKALKWQNVRGLGVVTITGLLVGNWTGTGAVKDALGEAGDEDGANKRQKTETSTDAGHSTTSKDASNNTTAALPTLDILPATLAPGARAAAQPFHVGDLRLADLRRAMQSAGHTAEFRGEGILLVDGSVVVRKSATGRIELESIGLPTDGGVATQMGGTFYAVKRVIYEGLAVVAGA